MALGLLRQNVHFFFLTSSLLHRVKKKCDETWFARSILTFARLERKLSLWRPAEINSYVYQISFHHLLTKIINS